MNWPLGSAERSVVTAATASASVGQLTVLPDTVQAAVDGSQSRSAPSKPKSAITSLMHCVFMPAKLV